MKQLFLTSEFNKVSDQVITLLPEQASSVLFIDTAAEVETGSKSWLERDRQSLIDAGHSVKQFSFTDKTPEEIKERIDQSDIIFVAGGNTFFLLQQIEKAGARDILIQAIEDGTPYIGSSAGSIIVGPSITITSRLDNKHKAPDLQSEEGLQLVNFVALPHWGNAHFKEKYLGTRLDAAYDEPHSFILLRDSQFVYVQDATHQIIDNSDHGN